jgi:hypothetical protein
VVAHTFNPSTKETEAGGSLCEVKASLVYRSSSGGQLRLPTNVVLKTKGKKVVFSLCELSLCFMFFREDYFAKKNEERKQSKVEAKLKAKQ